jgi:pyrimidine deaminase RibD-like protein
MTVAASALGHITDRDTYWMQRALELARRGIGVTSPSPAVGCRVTPPIAQF